MNSGNSELSNRNNAFIGWMEALGFILLIVSILVFREEVWLLYLAAGFILTGFFYRLYLDWKRGNKTKVRNRLILFFVVMTITLVLAYFQYHQKL